jgi:hypothetical protein
VERTLYFLFYIVYRGIRKDGLIVLWHAAWKPEYWIWSLQAYPAGVACQRLGNQLLPRQRNRDIPEATIGVSTVTSWQTQTRDVLYPVGLQPALTDWEIESISIGALTDWVIQHSVFRKEYNRTQQTEAKHLVSTKCCNNYKTVLQLVVILCYRMNRLKLSGTRNY